jgi:DNA-binding PadR family transcriptional regulator
LVHISNAELALLSLLAEEPRHAYELEQVIEERNMRDWTEIGFSSIYRLLSKLEAAGWLSSQLQPPEGRGPARKVYHLTPAGQEAWQEAALQNLAEPEHKFSSFLLGLDNLGALPASDVQQAIRKNLETQKTVYQHLSMAVENHPMRDDFYISIFFDYLLNQIANETKWLQDLSDKLETHNRRSKK